MEEVLVNGHVLCFLADSPMHAEVTNTPNPGNSLNPCRMCHLKADRLANKETLDYVQKFLMINPDGSEVQLRAALRCTEFWGVPNVGDPEISKNLDPRGAQTSAGRPDGGMTTQNSASAGDQNQIFQNGYKSTEISTT
jgi:hypothetical protein